MDGAASRKRDGDYENVYDFHINITNSNLPEARKQKSSVVKYTRLPEFEFDAKVPWHQNNTYGNAPRLRRFITIDEPKLETYRSLKSDVAIPSKIMAANTTTRKIVTIEEDDENILQSKFYLDESNRRSFKRTANRALSVNFNEEKQTSQRATSRYSNSSRYQEKDVKNSAINNKQRTSNVNSKKEVTVSTFKNKNKYGNADMLDAKLLITKNKDSTGNIKYPVNTAKVSVRKNIKTSESEKKIALIENKLINTWQTSGSTKKNFDKSRNSKKSSPTRTGNRISFLKQQEEIKSPLTVIHVPLDVEFQKKINESEVKETKCYNADEKEKNKDCVTVVDKVVISKDMNVATDPLPKYVNESTEIDDEFKAMQMYTNQSNMLTKIEDSFDKLDIPNVTLSKDRSDIPKEKIREFYSSKSLPNLKIPTMNITSQNDDGQSHFCKSMSYIISRATLTYTTRQEIDFHVVENKNEICSNPIAYPMNVVSVFKKEMKNKELVRNDDRNNNTNQTTTHVYYNHLDVLKSLNCSYDVEGNKLVKPSDLISTIRLNNSFIQSDYICEQFQRELNFIDSFFESLQYLQNCSLSEKCLSDSKVENWIGHSSFDIKNSEYASYVSKLDDGINIDNTDTMASKSLCLLDLLIRDEQRRAKNLLFVLKMREDALKDFTKSQILWLETKKKQENTDISTLKKKQRGALLKLQHECGEMQRIRKALLTLSEKRKVALKKNLELKLKNNVDVEPILVGKKRIKRSTTLDRNLAPLKCFDLSSSGCDDSTTARANTATPVFVPEAYSSAITSVEKSIQTGDSILANLTSEQSTNTAEENFVVVDGSYLNILFHNLSLPQIFSSGKQYEVNEEALKHIVNTSNTHNSSLNVGNVLEKFMDQIKNHDTEISSTPSTARSLVEELDQYYKGLADEDKSPDDSFERNYSSAMYDSKNSHIPGPIAKCESKSMHKSLSSDNDVSKKQTLSVDRSCMCEPSMISVVTQSGKSKESFIGNVAGPLPVPVGAAATTADGPAKEIPIWHQQKSSSLFLGSDSSSATSQGSCSSAPSISSFISPVHNEAEELRRQQLAIEREIKALEQQQCQLLVVREIPDKPPPPYTPPSDSRATKPPRLYLIDDVTENNIQKYIMESGNGSFDANDVFDVFVSDFCEEALQKHRAEQSEKPWDACNLLPHKQQISSHKMVRKTVLDLQDVLTAVTPTFVSGVGARRTDHIDDILFAEWRRCEPEWTALNTDEAIVKNQLFESIFQKILTETIDEYKRTVLGMDKSDK